MWKKISLAVLAVVAALAAFVATRPATYQVERSASVAAPPAMVLAQLADPQRWSAWWPRDRLDPAVERRYGGPPSGPGASYYWSGNAAAGRGRLTVLASSPDKVELEFELDEPRHATSDFEFRLAPEGAGTRVTWLVTVDRGFLDKAIDLLGRRQKVTAAEVEQGLAQLEAEAVAQARTRVDSRLERFASMAAPPAGVMAQLVDPHRWSAWSPWDARGPKAQRAYGGPSQGVGSSCYWSGGDAAGQGRMTVVSATADKVALELQLEKPRKSSSDIELALAPEGAGTRVSWLMTTERDPRDQPAGSSGSPDGALAREVEKALAQLKAVAEAEARKARR
jgi:carbon monoxide dehydrogenase subunit G